MRPRREEAYVSLNLDGRVEAMTAATSLTMAAFIMGTRASTMRTYGWKKETGPEGEIARLNPGTVFVRKIADQSNSLWVPRPRRGNSR